MFELVVFVTMQSSTVVHNSIGYVFYFCKSGVLTTMHLSTFGYSSFVYILFFAN